MERHQREEETESQNPSYINRCSIKKYTQDTDIPSYKVWLLCFVLVQSHHREEEAETRNASHRDPDRGVGSNFWLGGGRGTRLHGRDLTPTILVNFTVVLHVGNIQIQIVQLKYFKVSLPKEFF